MYNKYRKNNTGAKVQGVSAVTNRLTKGSQQKKNINMMK